MLHRAGARWQVGSGVGGGVRVPASPMRGAAFGDTIRHPERGRAHGVVVVECALVIGELRFKTPMRAFLTNRRFHELVAGAPPDEEPPVLDQRMVFNATDDGIRVIVQPSLVAIVRQGGHEGAVDEIVNRFVRIQREFQDLGIARVGVRSAWLRQVAEDNWEGLVTQFRQAFLAQGQAYERGEDLGVSFSSHGGEPGYQVQCGPMGRTQLEEQLLPFPDQFESPAFLFFADVDYWVSTMPSFNRRRVADTMREALTFASGFAEDLSAQFERNSQ